MEGWNSIQTVVALAEAVEDDDLNALQGLVDLGAGWVAPSVQRGKRRLTKKDFRYDGSWYKSSFS